MGLQTDWCRAARLHGSSEGAKHQGGGGGSRDLRACASTTPTAAAALLREEPRRGWASLDLSRGRRRQGVFPFPIGSPRDGCALAWGPARECRRRVEAAPPLAWAAVLRN